MELDKLIRLDQTYRSAPRRLHRLRRAGKIGPIPVLVLAHRRHGGPDARVGPAAFKHDGEGRGLSHPEGGPGDGEHGSGKDAHAHRRRQFPDHGIDRHFPEQRQEGACLLNHLQPRPDRGLRGNQHLRGDLVGAAADHLPRRRKVAPLSLRGDRRIQAGTAAT